MSWQNGLIPLFLTSLEGISILGLLLFNIGTIPFKDWLCKSVLGSFKSILESFKSILGTSKSIFGTFKSIFGLLKSIFESIIFISGFFSLILKSG